MNNTAVRKARAARKEARETAAGKLIEVEKRTPYRKPPTKDISRAEAQKRAVSIFGPRAFARKHTKTIPAFGRYAIGLRKTVPPFQVVTIGAGNTWKEATEAAVLNVESGLVVL